MNFAHQYRNIHINSQLTTLLKRVYTLICAKARGRHTDYSQGICYRCFTQESSEQVLLYKHKTEALISKHLSVQLSSSICQLYRRTTGGDGLVQLSGAVQISKEQGK